MPPEVQNRVISASTKGTDALQRVILKKGVSVKQGQWLALVDTLKAQCQTPEKSDDLCDGVLRL